MLQEKIKDGTPIGGHSSEIGPLNINRLDYFGAVELVESAVLVGEKLDIAICNAHTVLTAIDNPDYAKTLNKMTLLNDGVGVDLASRVLHGIGFPENLNGTDLVPHLLSEIKRPLRIYLLGAKEPQIQLASAHIEKTFPQHKVVGIRNGYFDVSDGDTICESINEANPDLLLVAMGNPRQETFIVENRDKLNVPVAIGVGALFDFMSGSVARAPKFMQNLGLEWLFRLLQEPKRLFNRYVVGIPRFLATLLWMKLRQS